MSGRGGAGAAPRMVVFAADDTDHPESAAIAAWLESESGAKVSGARLGRVASKVGPEDVVWIHGVEPLALESLGRDGRALLERGRLLLTGGAAVLPAAAGLEPVSPGESGRQAWRDEADDLYLFPTFSHFPRIRGHLSFRGHPLFAGLGAGAFTWAATEAEPFTRVAYVRPEWPRRARVLAVERSYIHVNAERATIWELDGGRGPVLCIGAYLPFASADDAYRENVERLAANALARAAGEEGATPAAEEHVWLVPSVEAHEDRSLEMPELPLLEQSLPSLEYPLRVSGPTEGDEPFTLAGHRAFAAGGEARGIDEVWVHPVRVASGPRVRGASAEAVAVTPLGLERKLRVDSQLVIERVTVPADAPACLLEWRASSAMELELEWTADLRLTWPYPATASAPLRWRRAPRGLTVGSGAGDAAAFAFSRPPEALDITDATEGEAAAVRVRARIRVDRRSPVRLVLAAAARAELPRALRAAGRAATAVRARRGSTERMLSEQLSLEAPDPVATQALEWAELRLDSYAVETPGVGRSLVAGYWGSGEGWFGHGRPGYAWYFGRDAVWTALASLAVGDFEAARDVLFFLGRHQALSGKVLHECSTSGVVHYDAADATPLYLLLMARYLAWSGDLRFVQGEWPRVRAALAFCAATDRDGDGLIENTGQGHGWVEFGRLGGGDVTLYNAAIWSRALAELADAAEAVGQSAEVAGLRTAAARAAGALAPTFRDPESGRWALNARRERDGGWRRLMVQTVMQAVPLLLGALPGAELESWLDEIATDRFTAPWGVRMLPADDPEYDPRSYHGGAVWPLFTGWASWAEYAGGRPDAGYRHWRMNVDQVFWRERGAWDEVLHGTERQARGVCPDQAWSTAMVPSPLVYGMLGAEPDAPRGRLTLRPRPPADWARFRVRHLRVGGAAVTLGYRRDGDTHRFTVSQERGSAPLQVVLAPELPGRGVAESAVDGARADLDATPVGERWRVPVQLVLDHERSLDVTMES